MSMTESSAAAPATPRPQPGPLRRILCTIDFSEASVAAVDEAVALARACRGEITVLFVLPYAAASRADPPKVPAGVSAAVTEDVEALLEPARAAGIPVRVCLQAGRPAQEILEAVRRTAPDVIVMGTHGRGGFKRRVLGSVTAEILRRAACPVLTAAHHRREPSHPMAARSGAILCAVGLSASSPETIERAFQVACATGGRLTLLHVVGGAETDTRESSRRLHALAAALGLPGHLVEEVVVTGVPARQILRVAAARHASLVVVGGKGASDHRSGSTADQVIRRAPCAVLTVPPVTAAA